MTRQRVLFGWLAVWFVAGLRFGLLTAVLWVIFSGAATLAVYYAVLLIRGGIRTIHWAFWGSSDQEVYTVDVEDENRP